MIKEFGDRFTKQGICILQYAFAENPYEMQFPHSGCGGKSISRKPNTLSMVTSNLLKSNRNFQERLLE